MERHAADGEDHASRIIAVLAVTGIVASLTQTLVVPLIASLPKIFNTTSTNASWIITATLLAGAVAMPVLGRLADMFGKRRIILCALIPLIAGSAICALAGNVWVMVAGRTLQGIASGIIPLGISLLHDTLPPHRVGRGIALMSSSLGIGGALGLPVAASIAQFASWRILFWTMALASATLLVLIRLAVPVGRRPVREGRFDPLGALLLSGALICLLLGLTKGASWGWASTRAVAAGAGAAVLGGAWILWELHTADALIDLRAMAKPVVLMTNIASLFVGFAMYAQSLIIPQIMQLPRQTGYGLGQTMLGMGLWMMPTGLAMMAVSPPGARLSGRRGARFTLVAGGLIMALGYGLAPLTMGSLWGLAACAAIVSAGVGFAYGAMPTLILGAVPSSQKAAANGFNALMRSIGVSVSSAAVAAILSTLSTPAAAGATIPSRAGFQVGLLIGCGASLLAALLARLSPGLGPAASLVESVAVDG